MVASASCGLGEHGACAGTVHTTGRSGMRVVGDPPDVRRPVACGCPCHQPDQDPADVATALAVIARAEGQSAVSTAVAVMMGTRAAAFEEVASLLRTRVVAAGDAR